MHRIAPIVLAFTATCCLAAFTILSRKVRRRRTAAVDEAIRDPVQAVRAPTGDSVAEAVGPIGKEWLHLPVAVALGGYLWRDGRGVAAVAPALASCTAELMSRGLDRLHLRGVPPGHPDPTKPSYPSGHALKASAVGLTVAYALARSNKVGASTAFGTAAALALSTTAGRLYLDRHWASDAAGGWLAGTALAAMWMAFFDLTERSRALET